MELWVYQTWNDLFKKKIGIDKFGIEVCYKTY